MRTTLNLEEDAAKAIQDYARGNGVPLGKAASELIRRGTRYQFPIRMKSGFPYIDVPEGFPKITSEQVKRILDEDE